MLSMTGYGYSEGTVDSIDIVVEIKSVNNRYCDINIKMPYYLNPYERDIKNFVMEKAQRGKIDVLIILRDKSPNYNIIANTELAKKYFECYQNLNEALGLSDEIRLSNFLKAEGVITIEDNRNAEHLWQVLQKFLQEALKQFHQSRYLEGKETIRHILECVTQIEDRLEIIRANSKDYSDQYLDKIKKRIQELVGDGFDENRILTEAGIMASKTDISEEMERLSAHIKQFKAMCLKDDAVGRQMDFISQEMNREINTIGAKANSIIVSEKVIDMKTELEKIKEQIRNVE